MRIWTLSLIVAVLVTSMVAADERAEMIVKKAIEAHGDAAALDKYKAGRLNMKGELTIEGMDIEFTGKLSFMAPDRFKMEMEAEIMCMKMTIEQRAIGDRDRSKLVIGGMNIPVPDSDKDELKLDVALHDAERLIPLLDSKKFEITAAPDEEVEGAKASVVKVKIKSLNKEAKFCFDKKSGLLVKTAHKGKSEDDDGKSIEVMEETLHKDHKKINGIQTATKLVVTQDGKKFMTVNASDIELLEKIDDKEFTFDD